MFSRRAPLPFKDRVRESVWPSMGWTRAVTYWRHRLFRTGDSSYKITAGLASGAAVSFNPFVGTHVAQAFFLAWILRANWLAAFIGTALGNPATLPFLLWLSYRAGVWLLALTGYADGHVFTGGMSAAAIMAQSVHIILPLAIGGYACGLVCWPVSYILLYYPVRMARHYYLLRYARKHRHIAKVQP